MASHYDEPEVGGGSGVTDEAVAPAAVPERAEDFRRYDGRPARPGYIEFVTRVLRDGPRDEDYLPVPDEVRRRVARDMAYARSRLAGVEPAPGVEAGQLEMHLLIHHYPLVNVVYFVDERGVVVVAAGLEEVYRFSHEVPRRLREGRQMVSIAPQPFGEA